MAVSLPIPSEIPGLFARGIISGSGSFAAGFVLTNVLQLFIESDQEKILEELNQIKDQLKEIKENQQKILDELGEVKALIAFEALGIKGFQGDSMIRSWFDQMTYDVPAASIDSRKRMVSELVHAINDPSQGISTILLQIDDIVRGNGSFVSDGVGIFEAYVNLLKARSKIFSNRNISIYDAYLKLRNFAASIYGLQYMGLTLQINAISTANPNDSELVASKVKLFSERLQQQDILFYKFIPYYVKLFGVVMERQGFIRGFFQNSYLKTKYEYDVYPIGENGYLCKRRYVDIWAKYQIRDEILVIDGAAYKQSFKLVLNKADNGTHRIDAFLNQDPPNGILYYFHEQASQYRTLVTGNGPLSLKIWTSGRYVDARNTLTLTSAVDDRDAKMSTMYTPTWGFWFAEPEHYPDLTGLFHFLAEEEIAQPSQKPAVVLVQGSGSWMKGGVVKYCYAYVSVPLGESKKSPVALLDKPLVSPEGEPVGGNPHLAIPVDGLGLATGYKLYRIIEGKDADWVDITDAPGVIWDLSALNPEKGAAGVITVTDTSGQ